MKQIEPSIVRIYTLSGKSTAGLGFLIDENLILTCAHVIATAVGIERSSANAPVQAVNLDFPLIASVSKPLTAGVLVWLPPQPSGEDDVAVLQLNEPRPKDTAISHFVAIENLWGKSFGAYGIPKDNPKGVWASGIVRGGIAGKRIQIEDVLGTSYFIEPGFSGSPVFSEELGGVIGMIASHEKEPSIRAGFMIPSDILQVKMYRKSHTSVISSPNEITVTSPEIHAPLTTESMHHSTAVPSTKRVTTGQGWIGSMKPRSVYIGGFKKIQRNYLPQSAFIAHNFFDGDDNKIKDYRTFFADGLSAYGYKPIFARDDSGTLLETICQDIINTEAGIYDVTGYSANVLIELGMSIGLNQPTVVIAEDDDKPLLNFLQQIGPFRYGDHYELADHIGQVVDAKVQEYREYGISPTYCNVCGKECTCRRRIVTPESEYFLIGVDPTEDKPIYHNLKQAVKDFNLIPVSFIEGNNLIVCGWTQRIKHSKLGFFHSKERSKRHHGPENAETMVQIGIAIGMGVPWRMILLSGEEMPADLKGYKYVSVDRPTVFRSYLTSTVRQLLQETRPYLGLYDPLLPAEMIADYENNSLVDTSPLEANLFTLPVGDVELSAILDTAVQRIVEIVENDCRVFIGLIDNNVVRVLASNFGDIGAEFEIRHGQQQGLTGYMISQGNRILINEFDDGKINKLTNFESAIQSLLLIPLKWGNQVVGLINISSNLKNVFNDGINNKLELLASDIVQVLNQKHVLNKSKSDPQVLPYRILIVNNNTAWRETIAEFLARAGYVVIQTATPLEAKTILVNDKVDLAILDVRLIDDSDPSDTSGIDLARTTSPEIPKIIYTSYPSFEQLRHALRSTEGTPAAVDFISADEGLETLVQAIQRAIPPQKSSAEFDLSNFKLNSQLERDIGIRLLKAGWNEPAFSLRANEVVRDSVAPDFVLAHAENTFIAIIEVKGPTTELTQSKERANRYRRELNASFAYIVDGDDIIEIDAIAHKETILGDFPKAQDLLSRIQLTENPPRATNNQNQAETDEIYKYIILVIQRVDDVPVSERSQQDYLLRNILFYGWLLQRQYLLVNFDVLTTLLNTEHSYIEMAVNSSLKGLVNRMTPQGFSLNEQAMLSIERILDDQYKMLQMVPYTRVLGYEFVGALLDITKPKYSISEIILDLMRTMLPGIKIEVLEEGLYLISSSVWRMLLLVISSPVTDKELARLWREMSQIHTEDPPYCLIITPSSGDSEKRLSRMRNVFQINPLATLRLINGLFEMANKYGAEMISKNFLAIFEQDGVFSSRFAIHALSKRLEES